MSKRWSIEISIIENGYLVETWEAGPIYRPTELDALALVARVVNDAMIKAQKTPGTGLL